MSAGEDGCRRRHHSISAGNCGANPKRISVLGGFSTRLHPGFPNPGPGNAFYPVGLRGGLYVNRIACCFNRHWATAPLSTKTASAKSSSKLSFAVSLVPTLKRYPVGALFGLVLTGVVTLVLQVLPDKFWLEAPITLICVPGCMLIERLLDWRFSGIVDARMRHAAAAEDARLSLEKLEDAQRRGFINKPDTHKIAGSIARRNIAGGPRQARSRGGYRKHSNHEPPPTSAPPSDEADATKPPG